MGFFSFAMVAAQVESTKQSMSFFTN